MGMNNHERYIRRCFDLAITGAGSVSPNPMVGAVIVHENRIIGEGFHRRYGQAHAEVNAVQSVSPANQHLLPQSTLYVSLEPCCIFGRTPPCTDLILRSGIPKVVISCLDQTPGVAGQGVQVLRERGVEVITGVLETQGQELARFRNTFVRRQRPYIVLKFAQTLNGYIGQPDQAMPISNKLTQRWVHKWRSEVDAILVGTQTALVDDPQLTNRLYFGKSPLRIVLDRTLRLPPTLRLFDQSQPTLVVTENAKSPASADLIDRPPYPIQYLSLDFNEIWLPKLLHYLYEQKISTLLVEGGAQLLQFFIENGSWDEALVLVGNRVLPQGVPAPRVAGVLKGHYKVGDDLLFRYQNVENR